MKQYILYLILGASLAANYSLHKKLGLYEQMNELELRLQLQEKASEDTLMILNGFHRRIEGNSEKLSKLFPGKHVEITIKEEEQ